MRHKVAFVIIGLTFLFGIIININIGFSSTSIEVTTIADKDSYVDSAYETSNYGSAIRLFVGESAYNHGYPGWSETYIHFNFSNKPTSWSKAEIGISCSEAGTLPAVFNLAISLIIDNWSETEITWMNKPEHKDLIKIQAYDSLYIKIDVSDYVEGNGISICLNFSDITQLGYLKIISRESSAAPHMNWYYEETSAIPGFIIPLIIFSLLGIIALESHFIKRRD